MGYIGRKLVSLNISQRCLLPYWHKATENRQFLRFIIKKQNLIFSSCMYHGCLFCFWYQGVYLHAYLVDFLNIVPDPLQILESLRLPLGFLSGKVHHWLQEQVCVEEVFNMLVSRIVLLEDIYRAFVRALYTNTSSSSQAMSKDTLPFTWILCPELERGFDQLDPSQPHSTRWETQQMLVFLFFFL